MTWSNGINLRGTAGAAGAQLRYGHGAPSSTNPTVQNDLDSYLDIDSARLYAVRQNGSWPSSYASLVGPPGSSWTAGTSTPSSSVGLDGDYFLNLTSRQLVRKSGGTWPTVGTTQYNTVAVVSSVPAPADGNIGDMVFLVSGGLTYLYTKTAASTWSQTSLLTGAKGDQGLVGTPGTAVRYGSGAPSSSNPTTQFDGDFYINNATPAAPVLYGPRASGSWPSPGVSLVGPQGVAGTTPPGLYQGSGAPTTTNVPGAVNGSYYVRNDVTPLTLYGPLANGTWPTSGVSMSGSQIYYQQGAPAAGTGNVNDYSFDITAGAVKLYPAKTSSGWTVAPVSLTGAQGATGAAGFSTLSSQSAGNERSFGFNSVAVSATASVPFFNGTNVPANFTLPNGSVLYGYSCTNPGVAVSVSLYNVTTSTNVITISIAGNVTVSQVYDLTSYPITANQQYQWRVTGSGTANFSFTPVVLFPAVTSSYNTSFLPAVGNQTSVTYTASQYYLPYAGTTLTNAQKYIKSAYLYAVTITNNANAALSFSYQYTPSGGSTTTLYNVGVAAGATLNAGPFTSSQYVMAVNSQASWSVSNSATGTCLVQTQIVYVGG